MNALELLQQLERMEVVSARPRSLVEARHGLEVVVHHVGRRRLQNLERALQPAAEIRHQHFDRRLRARRAYGADAVDEMLRAAVLEVVAIDTENHVVAQLKLRDGFREMPRLVRIGCERPAVRQVAEWPEERADVAEDYEGSRALA